MVFEKKSHIFSYVLLVHSNMPKYIDQIKDKLFENIFSYVKGGIAILSLEGKWVKVNQSVVDYLGYSEEEFHNMLFQDITHKDDLDMKLDCLKALLNDDNDNY